MTAIEVTQLAPAQGVGARTGRWSRALRTPSGATGLVVVTVLVAAGLMAPVLAPFDPAFQSTGASLLGPSSQHWLGTDELGRDIYSRLLYGIRQDVIITVLGVPLGQVIGVVLGLVATVDRLADGVVQRLLDVKMAFPQVILAATLATIITPGFATVLIVIVIAGIPVTARLTRSAVLTQRERDYVVGARVVGAGRAAILFRHILPNSLDALIVHFVMVAAGAIFLEGGLAIIGFGIQPPNPSLGGMIETGLPFLAEQQWYVLGPIAVLTGLVIGLNLLADGINAALRRG
ncbi:ABC transporter permease [Actinopolymorpha sp. B9G3]|uniref:ABC transporter permease n=1 Tax=Actinopolymorpha sp. B9G3 TaxID=3158970 RepID=UPI0032D97ABE